MGILENGRYTGSIIFYVQAQGRVYNPANGTMITGKVLKKNNMGLYVIYRDAIRILVPRDLHMGNEDYESLEVGDTINVEIRKSRFQIYDPFILSVANYKNRETAAAAPVSVQTAITAE
jgi:DNA-directed RNA polymerase subunit E'/Rpb7